jgi:arylsulfatase A-like enzyme
MRVAARILSASVLTFAILWLYRDVPDAQAKPANILIITADDLGDADIGVHGSRDIPTPNIDSLATNGVRFTDAYASSPLDSPSAAGMITGRYPQRFGHEFNLGRQFREFGLPLSEATIADRLKSAGYRTAFIGKWALGAPDRFHPLKRGFDEFLGFLALEHSYLTVDAATGNPIIDGRKPVESIAYLTDVLADRAVDYVGRQDPRPFLLCLAFNAPHTPVEAPTKYLARFSEIADPQRRSYAAVVAAMDDGVGRVLAALREHHLDQNTLVFFSSANGGPTMAGTTVNGARNAPLRGSKRQTLEGGIRVPLLIQWKGTLTAGTTERRPVTHLDVLPTALAAAGVALKPEWRIDGVNLLPFLTGKANDAAPHDILYWRLGGTMAVRRGDWKLVKTNEGPLAAVADPALLNNLTDASLYDLAPDVGEKTNLASSNPGIAKE